MTIEAQAHLRFLGSYNKTTRVTIPQREMTVDTFLQQYLAPFRVHLAMDSRWGYHPLCATCRAGNTGSKPANAAGALQYSSNRRRYG